MVSGQKEKESSGDSGDIGKKNPTSVGFVLGVFAQKKQQG